MLNGFILVKCASGTMVQQDIPMGHRGNPRNRQRPRSIEINSHMITRSLINESNIELPEDPSHIKEILFYDINSDILWRAALHQIKQMYQERAIIIPIKVKNSTIFIDTAERLSEYKTKRFENINTSHTQVEKIINNTIDPIFCDPELAYIARQNEQTRIGMKEAIENRNQAAGEEKAKWDNIISIHKKLPTMPDNLFGMEDPEFVFNGLFNGIMDPYSETTANFIKCYHNFVTEVLDTAKMIIDDKYAGKGPVKNALYRIVEDIVGGKKSRKNLFWGGPGTGKTYGGNVLSFAIAFLEIIRYIIPRINFTDIIQMQTMLWRRYERKGSNALEPFITKYNKITGQNHRRITENNFSGIFFVFMFDKIIKKGLEMHTKMQPRCYCYIALAAEKGDNGIFGESRVFLNAGPGKFVDTLINDPTTQYFEFLSDVLGDCSSLFDIGYTGFLSEDFVGKNMMGPYVEQFSIIFFDEVEKYKLKDGNSNTGAFLAILPDGGNPYFDNKFLGTKMLTENMVMLFSANSKNNINPALLSRLNEVFVPSLNKDGIAAVLEKKINEAFKIYKLDKIIDVSAHDIARKLAQKSSLKHNIRTMIAGAMDAINRYSQSREVILKNMQCFKKRKIKKMKFGFKTMMEYADPDFIQTLEQSGFNPERNKNCFTVAVPSKDGALSSITFCAMKNLMSAARSLVSFVGCFTQGAYGSRNSDAIRNDLENSISHIMHQFPRFHERFRSFKYIVEIGEPHPDAYSEVLLYSVIMIFRTLLNNYREDIWVVGALNADGTLGQPHYNLQETVISTLGDNPQLKEIVVADSLSVLVPSVQEEVSKRFKKRKIKITTAKTLQEFLKNAEYVV
jgi:hypothetical protein